MGYSAIMTNSKFYVKTENFGRVHKPLNEYGYAPETDDDGNITSVDFYGDKVAYDESDMFSKIAPFVADGSFIEMRGDDGDMWRWVFSGGAVREVRATITWPDDE
jgi:hypothetical protein